MINVILTDDHHIVREGIKFLLSTTHEINILNDFASGEETLNYIDNTSEHIDLLLIDLVMPEMDGIEVTRQVKQNYPNIKVLVLSSYTSEEYIRPVLSHKADGYIIKEMEPEELIQAIIDVHDGKKVIHPNVKEKMNSGELPHQKNTLSTRELEVLRAMVDGKSNREIGESLFVSEKTVKTHVSHILNKLEVSDRTKAVIYALKHNIVKL